jgi:hypothetical protein
VIGKVTRDQETDTLGDNTRRHNRVPSVGKGGLEVAAQSINVVNTAAKGVPFSTRICISLGAQEYEMPGSQYI